MKAGIIHRLNGMIVPLDFLKMVGKNNSHGFGFIHMGETNMEARRLPGEADVSRVFESQRLFPRQTFYWFADLPKNYLEADLQPFVLLSSKVSRPDREPLDIPLIACMMEGDFSRYYYKETGHVDAYNVAEKFFRPKIDQLWRLTNGNLQKVYEELSADHMKEEVSSVIATNGTIVLIFANGKDIKFEKSDTCRSFEWGWVSNSYGFGKKESGSLGDFVAPIINTVRAVTNIGAIKPENDPTKLEFYLKDYEKKSCPTGITRGKRVDQWYRDYAGFLPDNARALRPKVYMLEDRKKAETKLKAHLKKTGITPLPEKMPPAEATAMSDALAKAALDKQVPQKAPEEKPEKPEAPSVTPSEAKPMTASEKARARAEAKRQAKAQSSEPVVPVKDVTPHHLPDNNGIYHLTPKPGPNLVNIEDLPIIPPEEKASVLDYARKWGDADGEQMPDPDTFAKDEAKLPNAFALMGFKGSTPTYRWSYARFKELGQKYPDFLAILAMCYRNESIRAKILIGELQSQLASQRTEDQLRATRQLG